MKNCNLLIHRPPKRTSKLQENPSAFKWEHPALKTWNFNFCGSVLPCWIRIQIHWPDWIRIRHWLQVYIVKLGEKPPVLWKEQLKSGVSKHEFLIFCWAFFCSFIIYKILSKSRQIILRFALPYSTHVNHCYTYMKCYSWTGKCFFCPVFRIRDILLRIRIRNPYRTFDQQILIRIRLRILLFSSVT
jgi:hypothetical protein